MWFSPVLLTVFLCQTHALAGGESVPVGENAQREGKSSWGGWGALEDATWAFHIHPQGKGRSRRMKGYFIKTFPREQRVWGWGTES